MLADVGSAEAEAVELSIVVCVLDEEAAIDAFVAAVDAVVAARGRGHEYLFVDDGSSDGTWETISRLAGPGDVVGVRLLRNVGKENALAAGLAAARGEVHVPMDVDLQDPPEVLAELVREWRDGAQVVLARRRRRDDSAVPQDGRLLHLPDARERAARSRSRATSATSG